MRSRSTGSSDPQPAGGPISAYRRYWLPELAALVALAVAATILFASTDLDVTAARRFYHPGSPDPWPVAAGPFWLFFYRSAPWVTGSLAAAGAALLVAGLARVGATRLRWHGLFLLLCIAIGPGLIVNGVLKDHWGRPRPRQTVAFGGNLPYAPPLLPARSHGKSFPCGHCSVGYLYSAGWWIWRRNNPGRAFASLGAGLSVGTLLGVGRMAAGAHFLSDVVWSGLVAYGVAHVLYYHALRIPAREDSRPSVYPRIEQSRPLRNAAIAAVVLLAAGIVGGGLLASPHDLEINTRVRLADLPGTPERLEVAADTLDVELLLDGAAPGEIECAGAVHGFGLPTNEIRASWEFLAQPPPTLRYRVVAKGWFTDIDGFARIRIPAAALRRIVVRVRRGDIRVARAPGGAPAPGADPELELHTGDGRIRRY